MQTNAFTVDVEDYYHVSAFERHIDRRKWNEYPQRVADNTARILDLLAEHDVRATFYVLDWVAEKHPALVRRIASEGHELGSHSYGHHLVYQMTPEAFRSDLRRSKAALEHAAGVSVETYRAPSFSITAHSMWALDILVEEGFTSDSSIFPIRHDRYGVPNAEPGIHRLETKSGCLWEFPPSVVRMAGMNLPVSGGGYFRLYPYLITALCLQRINRCGRPFMFYMHPWEIDPEQPRLRVGSLTSRFRHYVNLGGTLDKLQRLLGRFRFDGMSNVLPQYRDDLTLETTCHA